MSIDPALLALMAAHPWIDVEQAAALSGRSVRQVGRALRQTVRTGEAQTCRIAGLCTSGALYALKAGGRVQLDQALLQIEALWGARNLLAHLARSETPVRSASPDRLQTPTAQGDPVGLDVLAWGVLRREDGELGFLIEWDLGEIMPEAYRRRFETFHLISRQGDPSALPVVVMVTTNLARAVQLLWLWRTTAARQQASPLRFYIAAWDAVASGAPDVWRQCGRESIGVPLFHGEAGQTQCVLQSCRVLSSRRGGPGFSAEHAMTGTGRRLDQAVMRAHLSIPDRATRRVLRKIGNWPLLSASELASLLTPLRCHESGVRSSLSSLVQLGLIAEYRHASEPARYHLAALGVQLLAAASGLKPARYARYRRWPAKHQGARRSAATPDASQTSTQKTELNLGLLTRHLEHTREVREFFVSLADVARRHRMLQLDHALAVWDENECRQHYEAGGRRHALVPDSGGVYRVGARSYEFFLEVDRGTMSPAKLRRKFDCYYAYRQTGEYLRTGAQLPRLLVIVPDEGRAHLVRRVILERARLAGGEPLDAWIAVHTTLQARGPAAPVWRHVEEWKLRCCFTDFEGADQMPAPLDLAQLSRKTTGDLRRAATLRLKRQQKARP